MDPLALLPYALAASGGRLNGHDVAALVAAGVTLLQRSAPLVRALAGRRSAVVLPPGPAWLVALAASDGRGLVVLAADRSVSMADIHGLRIGAIFTLEQYVARIPRDVPLVSLDEAPRRAHVRVADREQHVDLGSHFALDLVGDTTGPGAPEECVHFAESGLTQSHADVMAEARAWMSRGPFTPIDRTLSTVSIQSPTGLAAGLVAPLLAGGIVRVETPHDHGRISQAVGDFEATMLVVPDESPIALPSAAPDDALARLKRIVRVG